jgi:hypothetical protein
MKTLSSTYRWVLTVRLKYDFLIQSSEKFGAFFWENSGNSLRKIGQISVRRQNAVNAIVTRRAKFRLQNATLFTIRLKILMV